MKDLHQTVQDINNDLKELSRMLEERNRELDRRARFDEELSKEIQSILNRRKNEYRFSGSK